MKTRYETQLGMREEAITAEPIHQRQKLLPENPDQNTTPK